MAHNTLIFGGSGKVARHITRLLAAEGHNVYSIIRNPDQIPAIESLGGKPIVQSIECSSVDDFAQTIKENNVNAVIWSAGAGGGNPERTKTVDNEGAIKSFDATAKAGVKRFIMVSALDIRDRKGKPEPEWYDDDDRARSDRVWKAIGSYMEAKFTADRNLVTENGRRGLEFTIVRPGGLSEDPATGKVAAGKVHLGRMVPREDVAGVVVECLRNQGTVGRVFDVVGGEVGIREAVEGVVRERVDTFEGRY
ncbi:NAD(P)-binding protein [Teratosphaeria nubilosa]|uniref:NAD(P)-binding protein n=1 Tax=Teratosphaeria nubilosa TaxID=161662 RepID=A0A6G1KVL8_9PEZI|nr:NAD(P)-binding protein [Teratosphaeria nubilosa]